MALRPGINQEHLLSRLKAIQITMRDAIRTGMLTTPASDRSAVSHSGSGDTIYALDRGVEDVLLRECLAWAAEQPFLLIAEGLAGNGERVLPTTATSMDIRFRLIFDPVDGTRGLMYDKRSAWILAGLAPDHGPATSLADIVLAVMTEVPTTKQYLADILWAMRGHGAQGERHNLLTGEITPLLVAPSQATSLAHGFASLSKFFPGRKPVIAQIEEALVREIEGTDEPGKVRVFDDQYISTGGQLYELIVGHDRFNGDIRAALRHASHLPGDPPALAVHPYDVCTELIAREAGVIVTDLAGRPLSARLCVHEDVCWFGYANARLRARLEPALQRILREHGLLPCVCEHG